MLNIHSSLDLGAKDYTDILDEEERLSIQNLIDRNRYLETKAATEINNEINNIKVKIFKNYIPVSLVEETIKRKKEYKLKYEQEFADNKDENYFFDINAMDKEIEVLEELKQEEKINEDEVKCYIKLVKGEDRDGPSLQTYGNERDLLIGACLIIDNLVHEGAIDANIVILELLERLKDKTKGIKTIELKDGGKGI